MFIIKYSLGIFVKLIQEYRVEPNRVETNWVEPNRVETNWVEPNRVETNYIQMKKTKTTRFDVEPGANVMPITRNKIIHYNIFIS